MEEFISSFGLFAFFVLALSAPALGAPDVDPALVKILDSRLPFDSRPIRVIVALRDQQPLPDIPHSADSHEQMERAMMENARASQNAFLAHSADGVSSRVVRRFWLFNALTLDLPVPSVRHAMLSDDIKAIYADQRVTLQEEAAPIPAQATAHQQPYTWGLEKIGIQDASRRFPSLNGQGVRVGILDTGIDPTHPDLQGRLVAFNDLSGRTPGAAGYDDQGHGTHVAGTIAGGDSSGTQIGVAPKAQLVVAKIFDQSGNTTVDSILAAMQWMADPDGDPATRDFPSVVNGSWGGMQVQANQDPANVSFCIAVDAWVKLGILPVFAAGNFGPADGTVSLPAACPGVLAVGASDATDQVAAFSSRGPAVWKTGTVIRPNVVAPGVNVISSVPGGKYAADSGTSMAAPHVSGVAALLYQQSPKATIEQIEERLMATAIRLDGTPGDLSANNISGAGRIDALQALARPLRAEASLPESGPAPSLVR
ncbi:MAG: S8 family serine peptidase [Oligoflexia bacterium]|nr:S8 family serine peptidase [Oligoflexia bacterium]